MEGGESQDKRGELWDEEITDEMSKRRKERREQRDKIISEMR